jgi:aminoglycoside 6'-N-acetyltransferase
VTGRPAALRGQKVLLRPVAAADADRLRAIVAAPEVGAWWGSQPASFPMDDDPDSVRFTILLEDRIAGLIQFSEESEPDYRHASVDLFMDPALHSQGLGTDALETLCRYLVEQRRHHRITIDPAADNAAAIRCYEKAGFRPVGVMRSAWRDPDSVWRDVLLMERVEPPADRRRPPHP